MKKRILSIILFLVVSLGVEAVTRKELTQEVLSKIGIKQEIIDETIKLDEKFAGKSIFNMDEDELDARIKMMEEILEKDDRNFDLNDELFTIYILSEKKDYEKAKQYLEKSDKYNDKFSSYFNNIVYNRKVGKKKEAEKIYNKLRKEFKDKPLIDLADIFLEAMAGDDEDDSLSVMDENFLENNFYLNNPIENPEVSDHPLDNISKTSWSEEILFTPFKGSIAMEEMVFFHKKSSTLILTDLIESIEVNKLPLLYKLVFKFGDNKYPKFRTSRDLRSSFIFKKQAKDSYSKIESWKPDKIVFSHGKIILENGTEKLKEAFYWLRK